MKQLNRSIIFINSLYVIIFIVLMVSPRDIASQEISGNNNNIIVSFNQAVVNIYDDETMKGIFADSEIETLTICDNNLITLNPEIKHMHSLRTLDLSKTNLDYLPQEISQLRSLQEIHLNYEIWQYRLDEVKRVTWAKIVIE